MTESRRGYRRSPWRNLGSIRFGHPWLSSDPWLVFRQLSAVLFCDMEQGTCSCLQLQRPKELSAPRQNLWVEVGALVRSKEKDSASCPDPVWVVLSQNPMQGGTGCS